MKNIAILIPFALLASVAGFFSHAGASTVDISVLVWQDINGDFVLNEGSGFLLTEPLNIFLVELEEQGEALPEPGSLVRARKAPVINGIAEFTGLTDGIYRLELSNPQPADRFTPWRSSIEFVIENGVAPEEPFAFPLRWCGGCWATPVCHPVQGDRVLFDGQASTNLVCDHLNFFNLVTCCGEEFSPVTAILHPSVTNITVEWSTGDTNLSTRLPAGEHNLIVIDHDTGCVSSNPLRITSQTLGEAFFVDRFIREPAMCTNGGEAVFCPDREFGLETITNIVFTSVDTGVAIPTAFDFFFNFSFDCGLSRSGAAAPVLPAFPIHPSSRTSGPPPSNYKVTGIPGGNYIVSMYSRTYECPLEFEFEMPEFYAHDGPRLQTIPPAGGDYELSFLGGCSIEGIPDWVTLGDVSHISNQVFRALIAIDENQESEPRKTRMAFGDKKIELIQPGTRPMRLEFTDWQTSYGLRLRAFAELGRSFSIETSDSIEGPWTLKRSVAGREQWIFNTDELPHEFFRLVWD